MTAGIWVVIIIFGCICADIPHESGDRPEYEEYPEMVGGKTDVDGSKDT